MVRREDFIAGGGVNVGVQASPHSLPVQEPNLGTVGERAGAILKVKRVAEAVKPRLEAEVARLLVLALLRRLSAAEDVHLRGRGRCWWGGGCQRLGCWCGRLS